MSMMRMPEEELAVARRVGAAIRIRRLQVGVSQDELAAQLGLSRARVSTMERGIAGIRIAQLLRVAEFLSIPVQQLLKLPASHPIDAKAKQVLAAARAIAALPDDRRESVMALLRFLQPEAPATAETAA